MINTLRQLMNVLHSHQITQLDSSEFQNIPQQLYWKDKKGAYLGGNHAVAQDAGLNTVDELVGKTDFDLCWSNDASFLRSNDQHVISQRNSQLFLESASRPNGKIATGWSYKLPLRNRSNKIIGVIGFSFIVNNHALFSRISTKSLSRKCPLLDETLLINTINSYGLSKRQEECLYLLTQGYSIKKIGCSLNISTRTVEHHLEALKIKLNCYSRDQLIEKMRKG